jgi:hypothetical protein
MKYSEPRTEDPENEGIEDDLDEWNEWDELVGELNEIPEPEPESESLILNPQSLI